MDDRTDIINKINNTKKDEKEEEIIEEDLIFDEYDENSENEKNNTKIENSNFLPEKEKKGENLLTKEKEKEINSIEEEIKIEISDKAINTDNIPKEELNALINNNQELNIDKDINEKSLNEEDQRKKELINEYIEKEKLLELLIKSNSELKSKIEHSNNKYEEIIKKLEEQEKEKNEINLQIKNIDKEIKLVKNENEKYKNMIGKLKNQIDIKEKLEKDSNVKIILKNEKDKNKELKNKLATIKNINLSQEKYIHNYDKENHISEKVEIFKKEINQAKNSIKEYQEKYLKIEKFNKVIHEKIISIELMVKNLDENKPKVVEKSFTEEELKDMIYIINNLKEKKKKKRSDLNDLYKNNQEKLDKILSQNKTIELEIKENLRINKLLIFQRNELKRIIKNMIEQCK